MDALVDVTGASSMAELHVWNGKVVSVNKHFLQLIGYSIEEIQNYSITDFFNNVLKSTWNPMNKIMVEDEQEAYIFTKGHRVKKVRISVKCEENREHQTYTFVEKSIEYLQKVFGFLDHIYANSIMGVAIFSADELVLLKANMDLIHFVNSYYSEDETCIGDHIGDIFAHLGDSSDNLVRKVLGHLTESVHVNEFRYDFPVIGETYWDLVAAPVQDESGVKYIVLLVEEVTETVLNRVRLEEQTRTIQNKNQQLQAIFDNVSDGLFIEDYDGDKTTILANKVTTNFMEKIGAPANNLSYIKEFICYDSEGNEIGAQRLPLARIKEGERYEQELYTIKHKNKDIHLSISGTPLYDSDQKLKMAILCVQLVTDRVNHEKELQYQKDLYYHIFDGLGLPIIYLSYPSLELQGLNGNASNIIKDMVKGTLMEKASHDSFVVDRESFPKILSGINFNRNMIRTYLHEMERKKEAIFCNLEFSINGKKTVLKLVLQPIIKSDDVITEVIITGIDITYEIEQRDVMEKIAQMKDELVYTITHEFKTPLTVINSAIQAMELLCWEDMPAKAREYVSKIKQNSYRQLRLVNNLLDVNKMSIGKMKLNIKNMDIIHTTRLITESVQIYAQQKGIKLTFSSTVKSRMIGIDDEKYERILLNLLSNAIKFTPGGGSVNVRVCFKRRNGKLVACIAVEDEGIGIPGDKFDLIFERFGQVENALMRNVEGSGLGLTLVKQIVEAFGGEIKIDSKLGQGSTFTVMLPAVKAQEDTIKNISLSYIKNQLTHTTAVEFSDIYL